MEQSQVLDVLAAIGNLATPLLVILLTAVGWKIRTSIERRTDLENKLRDDRIEIYNKILEPFIILLMSDTAWKLEDKKLNRDKHEVATSMMLTLEYRRYGHRLSPMAPDSLVKSYNNLMQYVYDADARSEQAEGAFLMDMLRLLGTFLLEIRKSMGNEATKLDYWDMCEFWMSDARKLRQQLGE